MVTIAVAAKTAIPKVSHTARCLAPVQAFRAVARGSRRAARRYASNFTNLTPKMY